MPKLFSYIFLFCVKKIIVTNFSTKKMKLDHYGLSDEIDVFFKSLPPILKNGHFKNVQF